MMVMWERKRRGEEGMVRPLRPLPPTTGAEAYNKPKMAGPHRPRAVYRVRANNTTTTRIGMERRSRVAMIATMTTATALLEAAIDRNSSAVAIRWVTDNDNDANFLPPIRGHLSTLVASPSPLLVVLVLVLVVVIIVGGGNTGGVRIDLIPRLRPRLWLLRKKCPVHRKH